MTSPDLLSFCRGKGDLCKDPQGHHRNGIIWYSSQTLAVIAKPMLILLLIVVLISIIDHIEEPKLIDSLARAHHSQPVPQLLLLQELLGSKVAVAISIASNNRPVSLCSSSW